MKSEEQKQDSPEPEERPAAGSLEPCCPESPGRRRFLIGFGAVMGAIATLTAGVPILGYLFGPMAAAKDKWVDVGPADRFKAGTTTLVKTKNPLRLPWDGMSGRFAAYVRRVDAQSFQVFSVHCTHLGCPVTWFSRSGLFLCPCHGGVFYADGSRASGPPPRGLYHIPHRVVNGRLSIRIGHIPLLTEPA